VLVNDDDGDGRVGWVEWGGGIGLDKDPTQFETATIGSGGEETYAIREYEVPAGGEIDTDTLPSEAIDLDADGSVHSASGTPTVGGRVWLTYDDAGIHLTAIVEDETHHQDYGVFSMWRGDSIQLGIAAGPPSEATSYEEYTVGGNPR
jgi:hypothetical protein